MSFRRVLCVTADWCVPAAAESKPNWELNSDHYGRWHIKALGEAGLTAHMTAVKLWEDGG